MEIVEFAGYTEAEKARIAETYLVPRQMREAGVLVVAQSLNFSIDALNTLVSEYTHESGVRQLEREIGAVLRKIARRAAAGDPMPELIDAELVRSLLGRARMSPERSANEDAIGTATGMYYTPPAGTSLKSRCEVACFRLVGSKGRFLERTWRE